MAITVEFFGIPRVRAGLERVVVLPDRNSAMLSEVLEHVADQLPTFADGCMTDKKLDDHFLVSLDGEEFIHEGDALIQENRTVYILSADAGG